MMLASARLAVTLRETVHIAAAWGRRAGQTTYERLHALQEELHQRLLELALSWAYALLQPRGEDFPPQFISRRRCD